MVNKKIYWSLPLIFIVFALILMAQQYLFHGVFFELGDIHHETWILMFLFTALMLFLTGGKKW